MSIIRLFAISGSSEEEYPHCTEDRLSDLKDIQQPLSQLSGDDLHDQLVDFMGDITPINAVVGDRPSKRCQIPPWQ